MGLGYFFSLYWRNIKGSFIKGYEMLCGVEGFGAGFAWIILPLTSPITVPIGAGIKTISDYFTREYTRDEKSLRSISKYIDTKMTEKEMEEFTQELAEKKYNPHPQSCGASNSSKWLFSRLSTNDQASQDRINIENVTQEKRVNNFLQKQNVDKDQANNVFKSEYLETVKHDPQHDSRWDEEKPSTKVGFKQSKSDLSAYFKDEKNNGKKLFQLIVGFFSRKLAQIDNSVAEDAPLFNVQPSNQKEPNIHAASYGRSLL